MKITINQKENYLAFNRTNFPKGTYFRHNASTETCLVLKWESEEVCEYMFLNGCIISPGKPNLAKEYIKLIPVEFIFREV